LTNLIIISFNLIHDLLVRRNLNLV